MEDDAANAWFPAVDIPWNDSLTSHYVLFGRLERTLPTARWLRSAIQAWLSLMAHADYRIDELGLQAFPDECYVSSISPESLSDLWSAIEHVSAEDLLAIGDSDDDKPLCATLLTQWKALAQFASEGHWGLLIHQG